MPGPPHLRERSPRPQIKIADGNRQFRVKGAEPGPDRSTLQSSAQNINTQTLSGERNRIHNTDTMQGFLRTNQKYK